MLLPPRRTFSRAWLLSLLLFAVSTLATITWLTLSPYLMLADFVRAARAHNAAAMSALIDFPELRANLKSQLQVILNSWSDTAATEVGDSGALFGLLVGNMLLDPLVETVVSPAGLDELLHGHMRAKEIEALFALRSPPPARRVPDGTVAVSSPDLPLNFEAIGARSHPFILPSGTYESWDTFSVDLPSRGAHNASVKLVFTRQGLYSWRLSNIAIEDLARDMLKRYIAGRDHLSM